MIKKIEKIRKKYIITPDKISVEHIHRSLNDHKIDVKKKEKICVVQKQ
jgi:hypothetical protein